MQQAEFRFKVSGSHCTVITGTCFEELAPTVCSLINGHKAMILTDSSVSLLCLDRVNAALESANSELYSYVIPAGESSKNISELGKILEFLITHSFGRNDWIINLGGGVVSDLGGFSAAIYMRGIEYINIPTTLLGMVDSSFGGKTGIDFSGIKNVIGAFRNPALVVDSVDFLSTLTERDLRSGFGEIVKYHLLTGMDIAYPETPQASEKLVLNCIEAKYAFIENDVFDTGKRRLLNLGHTFGHAFEASSQFELSHGEAVALGLYSEALFASQLGIIPASTAMYIRSVIEGFCLSSDFSAYSCNAADFLPHDKKCTNRMIDLPLVNSPGKPFLAKVSLTDAMRFLC